jgi:hypothetical protein
MARGGRPGFDRVHALDGICRIGISGIIHQLGCEHQCDLEHLEYAAQHCCDFGGKLGQTEDLTAFFSHVLSMRVPRQQRGGPHATISFSIGSLVRHYGRGVLKQFRAPLAGPSRPERSPAGDPKVMARDRTGSIRRKASRAYSLADAAGCACALLWVSRFAGRFPASTGVRLISQACGRPSHRP